MKCKESKVFGMWLLKLITQVYLIVGILNVAFNTKSAVNLYIRSIPLEPCHAHYNSTFGLLDYKILKHGHCDNRGPASWLVQNQYHGIRHCDHHRGFIAERLLGWSPMSDTGLYDVEIRARYNFDIERYCSYPRSIMECFNALNKTDGAIFVIKPHIDICCWYVPDRRCSEFLPHGYILSL